MSSEPPMWLPYACVAAGGFVGAMARECVTALFLLTKLDLVRFPVPTLIANLVGAFVLSFLSERLLKPRPLYFALCTGFCGSFTTFSTFCHEMEPLINDRFLIEAAVYGVGSIVLGAVLSFMGSLIPTPAKGAGGVAASDSVREHLHSPDVEAPAPKSARDSATELGNSHTAIGDSSKPPGDSVTTPGDSTTPVGDSVTVL
jgi:CrcB protein